MKKMLFSIAVSWTFTFVGSVSAMQTMVNFETATVDSSPGTSWQENNV